MTDSGSVALGSNPGGEARKTWVWNTRGAERRHSTGLATGSLTTGCSVLAARLIWDEVEWVRFPPPGRSNTSRSIPSGYEPVERVMDTCRFESCLRYEPKGVGSNPTLPQ